MSPLAMRAALLERPGEDWSVVDDVEVEAPRAGEVLVRITHCGVCHSDLHVGDGSIAFPLPVIAGHEAAGVVEAVGAGVKSHAEGDHVVLTCRPPCGTCYWCARGEVFLCAGSTEWKTGTLADGGTRLSHRGRTVYRGIGVGGFAEYVVLDARGAVTIEPEIPLHVAAVLGCAVQTGIGAALHTTAIRPGDTVLVIGLGGVGVCIAQGARLAGASLIIGVDPVEGRRSTSQRFGVDATIDPRSTDVAEAVLELTRGVGVDHALDAVASLETMHAALAATRLGGTAVIVGVAPEGAEIRIPARAYVGENKHLVGCFLGSANAHRDFPMYLELWKSGRIDLEGLVTAIRPLDEVNDAFDDLKAARGLRTVLSL